MTNEQRKTLNTLKREISSPKSALLRIVNQMESVSPKQAEQLSKIIARLESFQNR
jgi:hypothetical protein